MGALTKLDLTADVTHLIVGSITTPKYRYVAKDRPDIAVLSPAWVEAVRVAWMEGDDDLDLEAIENEHRLPPFFGLQISITGFEEMEQRSNIERTVASNGGTYSGDMTRSTTHLLVADASVKSAKYIHARQWGINTVSLKWFEDSIIRGMALDESLYAPELPREQQGLGAFRQSPLRERTVLGKRGRPTTALESKSHEGSSRRKLRKATSLRLEGQSQDFWQEISAKDVQVDTSVVDAWGDETRASELASESARRTSTHNTLSINQLEKPPVFAHSEGLFSGHCILPFGFDESKLKAIKKYIEPNGAAIASSVEELIAASESDSSTCAYLLMPHDYPSTDLPRVPSSVCLITEWWIERSIQGKRALDPSEDVLSRPLPRLSDCSGTTICITGFTGVDYRQIAQALTIIGFSYQDKLLPSTSLLISGSTEMRKEKAYYAAKHQIPVVSADWLWSTMRAGRRKPMDKFLIKLSKPDPESSNKESPSSGNSARDESSAQK
jgi:NAD-dependent DNA ligase